MREFNNDMMKDTLEKISRLMSENYGIDISVYDLSFLEKTVNGRMGMISVYSEDDYCRFLITNPAEAFLFHDSLLNFYSEFFRNPLTFAILEQFVLPRIFNEKVKNQNHEVRIWSAGCAAGQEPYSLAILADNLINTLALNVSYRIFATDKSLKQLEIAGQGAFDLKAVQNTNLSYTRKYFSNSGDLFTVSDSIRKQVDFSHYDLLDGGSSSPATSIYGDFDLIMCSNLLFYYKSEIQKSILLKFKRSLRPGGFLVTGEAEKAIVKSFSPFRQYLPATSVFINN
jgi:chemotaxis protein methyltransferase CheR